MKLFSVLIATWCVLLPALVRAQATPYHYTIQANLPGQLIYCLEQDQFGRLLIGTDKGLYRYNGFRSTHIAVSGNSSPEITQLVKYGNDFIAANRSGQILHLKGDKLWVVPLKGFKGDIRNVSVAGKIMTITGAKYISRFQLPKFELMDQEAIPYTEPEGTQANYVLKYGNIRYAALNSGELVEMEEQASRNIPNATGKVLVKFARQLVVIPAYLMDDPVYTYYNGRFRNWGPLSHKGNMRVNSAKVIGNRLFVLSENGVFVYTDKMVKKPAQWFRGIPTTDIFCDVQGNFWIATKGKGLLFIPAGKHEVIFGGTLLSLEAGPNGTFFGGTLDGEIVQFDSRGRELKTFNNNGNSQEALNMYYDASSDLLFSNLGLFSVKTAELYSRVNETLKGAVRLSDGSVYLAKSSGVVYFPNARNPRRIYGLTDSSRMELLRREPAKNVVLNNATQEVAFSTVKGVFLRKGTAALKEITMEGKSIDAQALTWFGNDLIIATAAHELLLARNGRILKRLDLSINSGELVVLKMLSDKHYVYILTEKGMYRFSSLNKPLEGLKELIGFDGLVMRDFVLRNDQLYIVTQRGVMRFLWKQQQQMNYTLVLKDITGRKRKKYTYKDNRVQFPFDEKLIVIPFECVDLSGNQQFIVRYAIHTPKERGFWNALPASTEQLNLSHLNPGNYTVEFYLYDAVSQTKSDIQRKEFTVLYEWHNRPILWWFIAILVGFIIVYTWRWSLLRERRKCEEQLQRYSGK